jgi:hypothetical protein
MKSFFQAIGSRGIQRVLKVARYYKEGLRNGFMKRGTLIKRGRGTIDPGVLAAIGREDPTQDSKNKRSSIHVLYRPGTIKLETRVSLPLEGENRDGHLFSFGRIRESVMDRVK